MTKGLLEGIQVLDLTRLLPGPLATMILGDLGADVIKIEDPSVGDMTRWIPPFRGEEGALFYLLNRNKRSFALNLKSAENQEIFQRLAKKADIIVEGFRPGTAIRLGVDYDTIKTINPQIIYCSISGYGQEGPYRDLPGHDINYLGISGILAMSGSKEGPPATPPVQIADIGAGTFPALTAILAALFHRQRTGEGQFIDISMLDNLTLWIPTLLAPLVAGEPMYHRELNNAPLSGGLAGYGTYETADGYITLGALEPHFFEGLCQVLERPDFIERQLEGPESQEEMRSVFQKLFLKLSTEEWLNRLRARDVCCGPLNSLEDLGLDPQIMMRETLPMSTGTNKMENAQVGLPWKFSAAKATLRRPPPKLGEHNSEILQELGLADTDRED
ncbi:MAG: CaiB/BaiF CoA transferase family protein [Candidatus Hodarchaeales archaeon]|jgi:crotonobetainyl-CoA:carnitine CoA-transferase CaiB-like acyl-CoA transferase